MLRKLLPVLLAVIGLSAGAGAGIFLRPAAEVPVAATAGGHGDAGHTAASKPAGHAKEAGADAHTAAAAAADYGHGPDQKSADGQEYVKLNNQFIVPVLKGGKVTSLVILSLSLEVEPGGRAKVFAMEPKLRDALLRVLFDHANAGGFDGNFISADHMVTLRDALREAAVKTLGTMVRDVLIIDMVRQDA